MWAYLGILVIVISAIRSGSYMLWLWERQERWAAVGTALLTALSLAVPVYTMVALNP